MTIEREGPVARLTGRCEADEAEALLAALASGVTAIDLTGCEQLHAAIVQLLMAARPTIMGEPSPFLAKWIIPAVDSGQDKSTKRTDS